MALVYLYKKVYAMVILLILCFSEQVLHSCPEESKFESNIS